MSGVTSSSRLHSGRLIQHWDEVIEAPKLLPNLKENSVEIAASALADAPVFEETASAVSSPNPSSPDIFDSRPRTLQRFASAPNFSLAPQQQITRSRSFLSLPINKTATKVKSLVQKISTFTSTNQSPAPDSGKGRDGITHYKPVGSSASSRRSSLSSAKSAADSGYAPSLRSSKLSIHEQGEGEEDYFESVIADLKLELASNKEKLIRLEEKMQELDLNAEQEEKKDLTEAAQLTTAINLLVQERINEETNSFKALVISYISNVVVDSEIKELKADLEREERKIGLPNFLNFLKAFRFLGIFKFFRDKEKILSLDEAIKKLKEGQKNATQALDSFSENKKEFEEKFFRLLEAHEFNSFLEFSSIEFISASVKEKLKRVLINHDKYDLNNKSDQERRKELEKKFDEWIKGEKEIFKNEYKNLITEVIKSEKEATRDKITSHKEEKRKIINKLAKQVRTFENIHHHEVDTMQLLGEELFNEIYQLSNPVAK